MKLISTTEGDQVNIESLVQQIDALELRLAKLQASQPIIVESVDGVARIEGHLHNYTTVYDWGVPPYEIWPPDVNGAGNPYQRTRAFTLQQIHNAFVRWGNHYFEAAPPWQD